MTQAGLISKTQTVQYSDKRFIKNNVTGETLSFLKTARDTNGGYAQFELTSPPGFAGPPTHGHPLQEETFKIVSGRLGVELEGKQQVLGPGEGIIVPAGKAHRFWGEGDETVKAIVRITPALHFAELLDVVTRSANERDDAEPTLIDGVLAVDRYKDKYDALFLPAIVRVIVLPILAFIGRINGREHVIDQWISEHYQ
jgi:quercetin dioxygenase-like cupin family protein